MKPMLTLLFSLVCLTGLAQPAMPPPPEPGYMLGDMVDKLTFPSLFENVAVTVLPPPSLPFVMLLVFSNAVSRYCYPGSVGVWWYMQVQGSPDLVTWSNISDAWLSDQRQSCFKATNLSPYFYRLKTFTGPSKDSSWESGPWPVTWWMATNAAAEKNQTVIAPNGMTMKWACPLAYYLDDVKAIQVLTNPP